MKLTFRALVLLLIITSLSIKDFAQSAKPAAHKYLMYVGTYTVRGSEGIYAYRYDSVSGQLEPLGLADKTINPAFLAVHPNHRFLYVTNEEHDYQGQSSGMVSAFSIDAKTGKLTLLNQLASRGADPCHISVDQTGKFVLVANYTGGNLAIFPVLEDGRLGESSGFAQHNGTGPNKERQEAAHPHWIDMSPDNRFALSVDLTLDQVFVYSFDATKGTLSPHEPPSANLVPGAGSRHAAFHPNGRFVYVVNELNSTVTTFSYDQKGGTLRELQTVSSLPEDFTVENFPAEIAVHPGGKFLYASNRGHDSLVVYSIDPKKGTLTPIEYAPTKGKAPRNFEIDPAGRRVFVANQQTDNIVVFRIDAQTGRLTPTGQELKISAPICIRFTPIR
jgi:6-phosphogluconolactonase